VLVGALFLVSTVTFIVSNALVTPLLASQSVLSAIAEHRQLMIAATLIGFIEGVATVGIALALYPILKGQHPALALGYAGMRIAELTVAAVGFGLGGLLLVTLSGTGTNGANGETLGTVLVGLRHWTLMLVYVYTAIGGVMLSYMLLRTRLIPRGLSLLGLVGYPALLLAAVLDMLGRADTVGGLGLVGLVPGGVFELLLRIWLFVRGFNSDSLPVAGRRQLTKVEDRALAVHVVDLPAEHAVRDDGTAPSHQAEIGIRHSAHLPSRVLRVNAQLGRSVPFDREISANG
jgi:hypothetical protein